LNTDDSSALKLIQTEVTLCRLAEETFTAEVIVEPHESVTFPTPCIRKFENICKMFKILQYQLDYSTAMT
jgi:hypothetical protein